MATLYFRCKGASKNDFWTCYSLEQALYLGQQKWDMRSDKSGWEFLYVKQGDEIIKDWIN